MSEENPYATPSSEVAEASGAGVLQEPRMVSIGRGSSWLGEGFGYFKQSAGAWIGVCIIGFIIMIVLSIIPIVNFFVGLLTYVWLGGLMIGLRAQDQGESFQVSHLFAGFSHRAGALIGLGAILFVASMVLVFATFGSMYWQMITGGFDPTAIENGVSEILLPMLIMMLFMIPLIMTVWFAPVLIVSHDVSIFKAMSLSFKACLKNFLPFLLYGVIALILMVVAMIPFGLGMLVVVPMLYGSIYSSYKDIFIY